MENKFRNLWVNPKVLTEKELPNIENYKSALESANAEIAGNYKVHESLTRCIEIMEDKNKKLADENAKLKGCLEEIGADMYVGYKKTCSCGEAANKAIEVIK